MPHGDRGDGQVVTVWLPKQLAKDFRELASTEGVTPSWLARTLISDRLDHQDAEQAA